MELGRDNFTNQSRRKVDDVLCMSVQVKPPLLFRRFIVLEQTKTPTLHPPQFDVWNPFSSKGCQHVRPLEDPCWLRGIATIQD